MNDILVQEAEHVIKSMIGPNGKLSLTSSQLRKFLSGINRINNKVLALEAEKPDSRLLTPEIVSDLLQLKIRLLYQAGRETQVRTFVDKSKIRDKIDDVKNDMDKFKDLFGYVEALVAYHKYYRGRD